MYSETDIIENRRQLARECVRLALCALPCAALLIAGFALRRQALAMLGALALCTAMIFLIEMKLLPVLRYGRFLREIASGLRHETAGTLVRVEEEPAYERGVWFYKAILNVNVDLSEEGERLFLLDGAKRAAQGCVGRDVALTHCGRVVLAVRPLEAKGENDEELD